MQQQIREQLGSGLVDLFKSGKIYTDKNPPVVGKVVEESSG